jgi:hypothetical protein
VPCCGARRQVLTELQAGLGDSDGEDGDERCYADRRRRRGCVTSRTHPFAPRPPLLDARHELRRRIRQAAKTSSSRRRAHRIGVGRQYRRLPRPRPSRAVAHEPRALPARIMDVLGSERSREVVFAKSVAGRRELVRGELHRLPDGPGAVRDPRGVADREDAEGVEPHALDAMIEATPVLAAKFPKSGRRDSERLDRVQGVPRRMDPGPDREVDVGPARRTRRASPSRKKSTSGKATSRGRAIRSSCSGRACAPSGTVSCSSSRRPRCRATRASGASSSLDLGGVLRPVPALRHMQTLRWRDGDEDPDAAGDYRLTWERDDEGQAIAGTVQYICEECGCAIDERTRRPWSPPASGARATPGARRSASTSTRCTRCSAPGSTWCARSSAGEGSESMKSFVNTMLGLPYTPKGDSIDTHVLAQRAIAYPKLAKASSSRADPEGRGPAHRRRRRAGRSARAGRVGLGRGGARWLIAWEQLYGDPGQPTCGIELERRRVQRPHESAPRSDRGDVRRRRLHAGQGAPLLRWAAAQRVLAIIGKSRPGRKLLEAPDPKKFKRAGKKRPTHMVGTDSGKSLLISALRVPAGRARRACTSPTRSTRSSTSS